MPGQKSFLFFSLVVTAVLTYAPFSTLIWYEKGIPHNVTTTTLYKVVCPKWIEDDLTFQALAKNESVDITQYFVKLDSTCMKAVPWCEAHPELQGKVSAG